MHREVAMRNRKDVSIKVRIKTNRRTQERSIDVHIEPEYADPEKHIQITKDLVAKLLASNLSQDDMKPDKLKLTLGTNRKTVEINEKTKRDILNKAFELSKLSTVVTDIHIDEEADLHNEI
jgi:hypothetical protein